MMELKWKKWSNAANSQRQLTECIGMTKIIKLLLPVPKQCSVESEVWKSRTETYSILDLGRMQ